jgi:hypothetical protein
MTFRTWQKFEIKNSIDVFSPYISLMEHHITNILHISDDMGQYPEHPRTEHNHVNACYTILDSMYVGNYWLPPFHIFMLLK